MEKQNTWIILESRPKHLHPQTYQENLQRNLALVSRLAPRDQIFLMVSSEDIGLLDGIFAETPTPSILVKPDGIGNAVPLLILLMEIEKKDRNAKVMIAPCFHAEDPNSFLECLESSLASCAENMVSVMGILPETNGKWNPRAWIIPRRPGGQDGYPVVSLVRNADPRFASDLANQGAFLSADICIAPVSLFLLLYMLSNPELIRPYLQKSRHNGIVDATDEIGRGLPEKDFYRDVLRESVSFLRVLPVSDCGLTLFTSPAREMDQLGEAFIYRARKSEASAPPRRFFH